MSPTVSCIHRHRYEHPAQSTGPETSDGRRGSGSLATSLRPPGVPTLHLLLSPPCPGKPPPLPPPQAEDQAPLPHSLGAGEDGQFASLAPAVVIGSDSDM